MIRTEAELEDLLTTPSAQDVEAVGKLTGTLMVLGAGGKMGPTLAIRAQRAVEKAGAKLRVVAVSRFSDAAAEKRLQEAGVETLKADLLDRAQVEALPEAEQVIFMAGRKFGSTGAEWLTWAMNAYVPALVAERYRAAKIVAFSSGNVYPLVPVTSGGATEADPPDPVGEYAQSVLARERLFQYFSGKYGTPCCLLRLNYAIDLRYGVLLDIGQKVFERRPVELGMAAVNVIWQGDANSVCLRSFAVCESPPLILNLTGPETLSVRWIAERFGEIFGVEPVFEGTEADTALLNNAGRCHQLFGYPSVTPRQMIEWIAAWIQAGGPTLGKPTHFETRDGKF